MGPKRLTVLLSILSLISCGEVRVEMETSSGERESPSMPTALARALSEGKDRTLIVYGTSVSSMAPNGRLWVSEVGRELNSLYSGHLTLYNHGKSGQNSRWAIEHLRDSVLAFSPDAVLLEFATNDAVEVKFGITTEECYTNTVSIIDSIQTEFPDCEVILHTTCGFPLRSNAENRPHMDDYNAVYDAIGRERGLLVVDESRIFKSLAARSLDTLKRYTGDGVHPTEEGARKIYFPNIMYALTGLERYRVDMGRPLGDIGGASTEVFEPAFLESIQTLHHIAQNGFTAPSVADKYALMLFLSSLQGVLNAHHNENAIYLQLNNEYDWTDEFARSVGSIRRWGKDVSGLIRELLPSAGTRGYVLVDDFVPEGTVWSTERNQVITAVAASYAAAFQSMILTESMVTDPLFSDLECVFDARGKTMEDLCSFFIANPSLFRHDGIISTPRMPNHNVDLAIAHRWVAVHSSDDVLTGRFFSGIEPLSPRISYSGPYSSEGLNVRFNSTYDLYALAAGWCGNISTHERMKHSNLDREKNSRRPDIDRERTHVHYATILCSDGGNLEYFDKKFRDCFTHGQYGTFPVSFMMTPAMKKYKPAAQNWYYERLADNCSFVTSISGLGDIYPSYMSSDAAREEYGRLTARAMEDEGQRYFAIMDRCDGAQYTWDYIVDCSAPIIRSVPQCEGVIFLGYAKIWDGAASFVDGVPMVSIRFSCFYTDGKAMDDPANPKSQKAVADALKALPKDAKSPDGYSIILFNANPPAITPRPQIMDDMRVLVDLLQEDPDVQLVTASQFFELYNYHLGPKGE